MIDSWLQTQASVLSLTFSDASGRITSGSGFKVRNVLITNNHVVQVPRATHVQIRSVCSDSFTSAFELNLTYPHFQAAFVEGDPETAWDFAVFRIDGADFARLPSLQLAEDGPVEVGTPIAIFGYQFDQPQQSMHLGHISSQYHRAGVHYLQLDSSVNHGNSGGPLVDTRTGRVVGIVTRKATGLTAQFEQLMQAFGQNIAGLQQLRQGGYVTVGGIDPVATTIAIQEQLRRLAIEISRSANVGIGYAYHVSKVRECVARVA
ncbi:MAG: serine protease [Rubrivivax sp.]